MLLAQKGLPRFDAEKLRHVLIQIIRVSQILPQLGSSQHSRSYDGSEH